MLSAATARLRRSTPRGHAPTRSAHARPAVKRRLQVVDSKITPTAVDYANKDDDEVKKKLRYVYGYGITMYMRGMLKEDFLKEMVLERLAGRVGLDATLGCKQWQHAQQSSRLARWTCMRQYRHSVRARSRPAVSRRAALQGVRQRARRVAGLAERPCATRRRRR